MHHKHGHRCAILRGVALLCHHHVRGVDIELHPPPHLTPVLRQRELHHLRRLREGGEAVVEVVAVELARQPRDGAEPREREVAQLSALQSPEREPARSLVQRRNDQLLAGHLNGINLGCALWDHLAPDTAIGRDGEHPVHRCASIGVEVEGVLVGGDRSDRARADDQPLDPQSLRPLVHLRNKFVRHARCDHSAARHHTLRDLDVDLHALVAIPDAHIIPTPHEVEKDEVAIL